MGLRDYNASVQESTAEKPLRGMLPPPPPDREVELQLELTRTGLHRLDTSLMEALRVGPTSRIDRFICIYIYTK